MSRTRTTTYPAVVMGPVYWQAFDSGDNLLFTAVESNLSRSGSKAITDVVTPNYFSRLSRGEFLPVNPVTIVDTQLLSLQFLSATMVKHVTEAPPGVNSYKGAHSVILADSSIDDYTAETSMMDNTVIKALASAKTADWDLLTFVGEFHESVELLKTAMERIFHLSHKLAKVARRREFRRSRRHRVPYSLRNAIKIFNGLWLESRYGWRPLVYDILSIMRVLKAKASNPLARKSATIVKDISLSRTESFHNADVKYTCTTARSGTCTYHAVVFYKDMMGHIGANPVITAYELTRLSFVIDWFIDINSWLHAILPREGYTELGISISAAQDYTLTLSEIVEEQPGGLYAVSMSAPYRESYHVRKYERKAYTDVPLPHLNINLDPLKVLDGIALLIENGRSGLFSRLRL